MKAEQDTLRITGLRKSYGETEAVRGISFAVHANEILAILGPNGAGKTTTINCLAGLIRSDGGTLFVKGVERAVADKEFIGLCPQEIIIWEHLTVLEQLLFIGSLYRIPKKECRMKAVRLLDALGLIEKQNARGSALSGGMKRRLNIALSLVHDPGIIILDEPEAGLDPQSRLLVRNFLAEQARHRSVILTTHNMDEAQRLAGRVVLIDCGVIIAEGSVQDLLEQNGCRDLEEVFFKLTGRTLRDN